MKTRKLMIRLLLFALVSGSVVTAAYLWCFRPLVPTTRWQVKAETPSGETIPVETYWMLGCRMPLFLCVGGKWFTVSLSTTKARVGIPNYPRTSPYLHFVYDQSYYGVDIFRRDKIAAEWFLHHAGNSLVFSNAQFAVSVSPKR